MLYFLLIFLILFTLPAFAQTEITLSVNGNLVTCDVPPIIVNDRTLVPARALFESLGATLDYDGSVRRVTIQLNDTTILLTIDSATAYVNGAACTLEAAPVLVSDRTLLPARFVAEQLGFSVDWDNDLRRVLIWQETHPNTITKIQPQFRGQYVVLDIYFSKPLEDYKVYPLGNPTRTVLELNDCTYADTTTINVADGGLQRIRMGNHPEYFKLVADLDENLPYEFSLSGDRMFATMQYTLNPKTSIDPPAPPAPGTKTVVIDAGHGGTASGTLGRRDGQVILVEKELTLTISMEVVRLLRESGVNVLTTRTSDVDVPLVARAEVANNNNADLFVSVHINYFDDPSANGSLVLYNGDKDQQNPGQMSSKKIAEIIEKNLVSQLGTRDGGVRSEPEMAVLRHTVMPAVLVETAFASNPKDQELLLSHEKLMAAAKGIANGILEVLGQM